MHSQTHSHAHTYTHIKYLLGKHAADPVQSALRKNEHSLLQLVALCDLVQLIRKVDTRVTISGLNRTPVLIRTELDIIAAIAPQHRATLTLFLYSIEEEEDSEMSA